jgi:alcohol-forming fatty acyl-CoA reductase
MEEAYIADFYRNRSVFLTGGTGFMGKVLIEKLLRSCPDMDTIYLLVRPKSGCQASQRIQELVDCKVSRLNRAAQRPRFPRIVPLPAARFRPNSSSDCQIFPLKSSTLVG